MPQGCRQRHKSSPGADVALYPVAAAAEQRHELHLQLRRQLVRHAIEQLGRHARQLLVAGEAAAAAVELVHGARRGLQQRARLVQHRLARDRWRRATAVAAAVATALWECAQQALQSRPKSTLQVWSVTITGKAAQSDAASDAHCQYPATVTNSPRRQIGQTASACRWRNPAGRRGRRRRRRLCTAAAAPP